MSTYEARLGRVVAALDPENLLEHLPKKNGEAVIRCLCVYRQSAEEALDSTVDGAEMEERILLAEHFPRYGSDRRLSKRVVMCILLLGVITITLLLSTFVVGFSDYWLEQTALEIVVQVALWVLAFLFANFSFVDGESGVLMGESCVLTNLRAIRVFDPTRWTRAYTESFWYDTIDPYWLQVLKEKKRLASYSILFHPPPAQLVSFEDMLSGDGKSESPDSPSRGMKLKGDKRRLSVKNNVTWLPLQEAEGAESVVEEQAASKEQAWLATPRDRVGFLRLGATRDTVQRMFRVIRENAAPTFLSYTTHYCTISFLAWSYPHRENPVATMESDEWHDIEGTLKRCRVPVAFVALPFGLILCFILSQLIVSVAFPFYLAFLVCNSSTIVLAVFGLTYFTFRNWFQVHEYRIMEQVDVAAKVLNIKYRMHNVAVLNRHMKVDIKAFESSPSV